MKSTTSCSLFPAFSCSRIWLRRSTASGAFESASVWFWHTRQRSSLARVCTCRSRASSAHAADATRKINRKQNLATRAQLLDQGNDLVARDLGSERADVLVADDAA